MDRTIMLDSMIEREKAYIDGVLGYVNRFEDEFSLDEHYEIKTYLWNKFVLLEFEQIFCEIDPTLYNQISIEKDAAKKVSKWHEFDRKYRTSAVQEWKKRYYSYRYIDGYYYFFYFDSGLILYDNFDFYRYKPEQFAPQVQRWIEGDLEINNNLEKKLKWTRNILAMVSVSLIITVIVLIAY